MAENIYYIYIHFNSLTNEPFYVGRGKGNRYKSKSGRNKFWKNYVNKYGYYSEKIIINQTLEMSCELEKIWIRHLIDFNYRLVNISSGGEGNNSGVIRSNEWKNNISIAKKGKPSPKKGVLKYKTPKEQEEARLKNLEYKRMMNKYYHRKRRNSKLPHKPIN